ncbi:MAG: hypothetical protein EOP49_46870, partial [Sphingobacteriales bacterium]
MKRLFQLIISVLMFVLVASIAAHFLQEYIQPAVTVTGMVCLSFIAYFQKTPADVYRSGVAKEMWVDYVVKRFWKDNAWMKSFKSDDQYVVNGKTVHVPQPGSKPTVTKNPSSWPLSAAQRTDSDVNYDLDFYVTAPTHISDAEEAEVSYNKMDSVLG